MRSERISSTLNKKKAQRGANFIGPKQAYLKFNLEQNKPMDNQNI